MRTNVVAGHSFRSSDGGGDELSYRSVVYDEEREGPHTHRSTRCCYRGVFLFASLCRLGTRAYILWGAGMSGSDKVRVWRLRTRGFAVVGALCFALIWLLKILGSTEFTDSLIGPLVLLFVILWLSGLYCTHRYWKDFREDEIQRGGSAETASEKWHELHPPPG